MKTLGIIGGMGPKAALDLCEKILHHTSAKKDQDHIPVILYNQTKIPDRSGFLLEGGENPLPLMVETAKTLARIGADFLAMACNTAHYFHQNIQDEIEIPLLHMIELTALAAKKRGERFLLLGTQGTYKIGLYEKAFSRLDVDLVLPEEVERKKVMDWIYAVKAGKEEDVQETFREFLREKKGLIPVLACTELPLLMKYISDMEVFDPTDILAQAIVDYSLSK